MKKLKKFIDRLSITRASDEKDYHQPRDVKLDSLMSTRSEEASPVSR
jgi:hypothetical protein